MHAACLVIMPNETSAKCFINIVQYINSKMFPLSAPFSALSLHTFPRILLILLCIVCVWNHLLCPLTIQLSQTILYMYMYMYVHVAMRCEIYLSL